MGQKGSGIKEKRLLNWALSVIEHIINLKVGWSSGKRILDLISMIFLLKKDKGNYFKNVLFHFAEYILLEMVIIHQINYSISPSTACNNPSL